MLFVEQRFHCLWEAFMHCHKFVLAPPCFIWRGRCSLNSKSNVMQKSSSSSNEHVSTTSSSHTSKWGLAGGCGFSLQVLVWFIGGGWDEWRWWHLFTVFSFFLLCDRCNQLWTSGGHRHHQLRGTISEYLLSIYPITSPVCYVLISHCSCVESLAVICKEMYHNWTDCAVIAKAPGLIEGQVVAGCSLSLHTR